MTRSLAKGKTRDRRIRNPVRTRATILKAARKLLAKNGPEGLSVPQVALTANVNFGTVYLHFPTRTQLLAATIDGVSEDLCRAVFGDAPRFKASKVGEVDPQKVTEQLAEYAIKNPELGRIWLFQLLSSRRPANDVFFRQYKMRFDRFTKSEFAQPAIDGDVHTVLTLGGAFMWAIWAGARSHTAKERKKLAARYSYETVRLSLQGMMRPKKVPELAARVTKHNTGYTRKK